MCAFETRLCLEQVVEAEAAAGEEEAAICPVPTIGPYSLPPLAEPPPPPPPHLLISVYPAPLLGGGRPVLLVAERAKDGDRAGTCRPQSFPTRACELRPQHNPPHIQRYQTIPDDRQLNVSAGTEERLICRRRNNARDNSDLPAILTTWKVCLKQVVGRGAEGGDGEHAVPRSPE